MKMPSVERLAVRVRKESLTERSGPASQAVSCKSEHYSPVTVLISVKIIIKEPPEGAVRPE